MLVTAGALNRGGFLVLGVFGAVKTETGFVGRFAKEGLDLALRLIAMTADAGVLFTFTVDRLLSGLAPDVVTASAVLAVNVVIEDYRLRPCGNVPFFMASAAGLRARIFTLSRQVPVADDADLVHPVRHLIGAEVRTVKEVFPGLIIEE